MAGTRWVGLGDGFVRYSEQSKVMDIGPERRKEI